MKKILKVVYIAFAAVIGIIVGFASYYSYTYDYIFEQTNTYINNKDYGALASMYSYWYEGENIAPENSCDKYQLGILRGGVIETNKYYEKEGEEYTEKTATRATDCYYIYISNITFDSSNCSTGNSLTNLSGVRFYSGENTYDYLFTISNTVNKTMYKEKPATEIEAITSSRNLISSLETWGFIDMQLTPKIIEAMGFTGVVDGLAIVDNSGDIVGNKLSINFDFTGDFFTFYDTFVVKYNQYVDAFNAAGDDEDKKSQANSVFNDFYDSENGYKDQFVAEGYGINLYSNPGFIIWKSIGTVALFALAVVLLYILIFHFKWLKGLLIKDNKSGRYRVSNKQIAEMEAKKNATVKADYKEIRPKTEEEKKENIKQTEEPKAEEAKEVIAEESEKTEE